MPRNNFKRFCLALENINVGPLFYRLQRRSSETEWFAQGHAHFTDVFRHNVSTILREEHEIPALCGVVTEASYTLSPWILIKMLLLSWCGYTHFRGKENEAHHQRIFCYTDSHCFKQ